MSKKLLSLPLLIQAKTSSPMTDAVPATTEPAIMPLFPLPPDAADATELMSAVVGVGVAEVGASVKEDTVMEIGVGLALDDVEIRDVYTV